MLTMQPKLAKESGGTTSSEDTFRLPFEYVLHATGYLFSSESLTLEAQLSSTQQLAYCYAFVVV